jgi:hypothetical protein
VTPIEAAAAALDPNWFYSSLAQSAASFVGLFGGILAASVQAQHEPAALQRERATAALRVLNEQLRSDQRALSDYRDHAPGQIAATRAGMADGETEVRFENFYHPFGVVPDNKGGQGCTQAVIDVEEERLALTLILVPLVDRAVAAKSRSHLTAFVDSMRPFAETPVNGMGGVVRKLVERAERASLEVERLELRTRTGTWGVLLVALILVVLTGLVAPLFELSLHNACGTLGLAGASLFAVGLLVLLVYVQVQIVQLRGRGRFATLLPPAA